MIPRIQNILYATDLSENSAYAFRYAVNSAQKHSAKIHLLHVVEMLHPAIAVQFSLHLEEGQIEKLKQEKRDQQLQRIRVRLQEFAKRELKDEPEGLKMVGKVWVVEGDPATEILKKMDDLQCDILIIGSHGKGFLAQAFLGSVAEKVLHRIHKPVYIIPLPKGDTDITFHDV